MTTATEVFALDVHAGSVRQLGPKNWQGRRKQGSADDMRRIGHGFRTEESATAWVQRCVTDPAQPFAEV